MQETRLGMVEAQFADIIWQNAPLTTRQLVNLCAEQLNWARTTTYTVLKKLCDRGVFQVQNSIVTILIEKDAFYAIQSEEFVENTFGGSLPAFLAAFTSRKKLSEKELAEIQRLLEEVEP